MMRTRLPALRTLPSRTCVTPSFRATSSTFMLRPLKVKALLREAGISLPEEVLVADAHVVR